VFVDLGARLSVQANAGCDRIYFSRLEGGVSEIVRESR
jgi:hypothetical protein